MDRVGFIICGAQKSGTTALVEYLKESTDIVFPNTKEPHYFDNESLDWGMNANLREDYYHSMFNDVRGKLRGECTPVYMYWKESAERIWKYNSRMKLAILLRDPVERAYSHWNMEVARGRERASFDKAIDRELAEMRRNGEVQDRVRSYISRGLYCKQLERMWSWFGKEQVRVFRNEDLLQRHMDVIRDLASFLGVAEVRQVERREVHKGQYNKKVDEKTASFVRSYFESDIKKLQSMLGWDLKEWMEGTR